MLLFRYFFPAWELPSLTQIITNAVAFASSVLDLLLACAKAAWFCYKFISLMPKAALKGKAVVKIGMQYGKVMTGARFQKPPKRKPSFTFFIGDCSVGCVRGFKLVVGCLFFILYCELSLQQWRRWGTVDTFLHFRPLLLYCKSKQAQNLSHNKATLYTQYRAKTWN